MQWDLDLGQNGRYVNTISLNYKGNSDLFVGILLAELRVLKLSLLDLNAIFHIIILMCFFS